MILITYTVQGGLRPSPPRRLIFDISQTPGFSAVPSGMQTDENLHIKFDRVIFVVQDGGLNRGSENPNLRAKMLNVINR